MAEPGRTSLTPFAHLMRDVDENGARSFAARLWHEHGTVIFLAPSLERMAWQDRELIREIAARLYGKKDSLPHPKDQRP